MKYLSALSAFLTLLLYPYTHAADINHLDEEYIRKYGPFPAFKTEPQLEPSTMDVVLGQNNLSLAAPGHFIFTLSTFTLGGYSWGPQIFDSDFNLVYMASPDHKIASQDPHVCDFQGSSGRHLCVGAVGAMTRGRGKSVKLVYNSSYEDMGTAYGATGGLQHPDGHEYNMLSGGDSLLQLVYEPRNMDLTPFDGPKNGFVLDACLQEVSVSNAEPQFQWCFLDHYPVWETYIFPAGNTVNLTSPIAGHGTENSKWDLIHANGADKNFEGDYIVSMRHLDQVIKIAGNNNPHGLKPGAVLWRLGGKHGDFDMNDATFSRQHHARFIETTAKETVISLFDNSWEGHNDPIHDASAGRIIKINNETMQAHLVREYLHPLNNLSLAQGSMQVLPNKNAFVGWGWNPEISEFHEDGNLIYHARLSSSDSVFAYRVFKTQWVGKPLWPPKLLAYSQTCGLSQTSPLVIYASWNGATEVRAYRFFISIHKKGGMWIPAGTFPKMGFETRVQLFDGLISKWFPFVRHVKVDALDSNGQVLGSSSSKTFVPMSWAAKQCNQSECFKPPRFNYGSQFNSADTCEASVQPAYVAFVFLLICIECFVYLYFWGFRLFCCYRNLHSVRWPRRVFNSYHESKQGLLEPV